MLGHRQQWFSRCDPADRQTTWQLVTNANSRTPLQTSYSETSLTESSGLCFTKLVGVYMSACPLHAGHRATALTPPLFTSCLGPFFLLYKFLDPFIMSYLPALTEFSLQALSPKPGNKIGLLFSSPYHSHFGKIL